MSKEALTVTLELGSRPILPLRSQRFGPQYCRTKNHLTVVYMGLLSSPKWNDSIKAELWEEKRCRRKWGQRGRGMDMRETNRLISTVPRIGLSPFWESEFCCDSFSHSRGIVCWTSGLVRDFLVCWSFLDHLSNTLWSQLISFDCHYISFYNNSESWG